MKTSKPLWLLDVDGVINPDIKHSLRAQARYPEFHWRQIKLFPAGFINGLRIIYADEVVLFIWEMYRSGLVEIKWLTTWVEDANLLLVPALHLPALDVVGFDKDAKAPGPWWKLPLAQRESAGRPLIWTDDDLAFSTAAQEWLSGRSDVVAIAPDEKRGLTLEHMQLIREFVKESVDAS